MYLPEDAQRLDDFLDEHTHFPNAAYANQVYTTAQALDFISQKAGRIISDAKVIRSRP